MTESDLANLVTARSNFAAQLASLSASPKPTYTVGNQSFTWTEYLKFLTENIQALDEIISEEESGGGDAWGVVSVGVPG